MRAFARSRRHHARRASRALLVVLVVASGLSLAEPAGADTRTPDGRILGIWEVQSLDGANNNRAHPDWGKGGTIYPRVAPANYADGIGEPVDGPNPRYISNRIINDTDQDLYSERNVSQWAFVWGQFLDHTFAMRLGRRQSGEPGEPANIPTDGTDPLESFRNDLGMVFFERSIPAADTGVTTPRDQVNQLSSYIDAHPVYGTTDARLDWLREGLVDGNPANNDARLLLPGNYLPRRESRGDPSTAPPMVIGGALFPTPHRAAVAGDQRANENPALLATHTLFAREHNRIVSQLPSWVSEQDKFEIARAVVIAEQQYITYTQFLPALGVTLPRYNGYQRDVDAGLTNEFATVGYRAHSQIRSDFQIEAEVGRYSEATLDALRELGVRVTIVGDTVELLIPLGEDAFFNPDLLELLQLGPMLEGIGLKPQTRNDEQIDNLLRSLQFVIPVPENPTCVDDPALPSCIHGYNDLGSIDIARSRDHGMPTYNQLRAAYGLPARTSFAQLTGEASEAFPADPLLTPGAEVDDPNSLDFTELYDIDGNPTTPEADNATMGVRRTPLAARLKAVYGNVDRVDAFIGMMAEPHLPGRDFGELQLAMWRQEFTALRDGDRFFYANDPLLPFVRHLFGIDYRRSLRDIIAANSDIPQGDMAPNVFFAPAADAAAAVPFGEREHSLTGPLAQGDRHREATLPGHDGSVELTPLVIARAAAIQAARRAPSRKRRVRSS